MVTTCRKEFGELWLIYLWSGSRRWKPSSTCICPCHILLILVVQHNSNSQRCPDLGKWTVRSVSLCHTLITASPWWDNNFLNNRKTSWSHTPSSWSILSSVQVRVAPAQVPLQRTRSCLLFQLLLCQEVLEELVHWPGNGSGGHLVYNPSLDPFEKGWQTTKPVHCPEGISHSR